MVVSAPPQSQSRDVAPIAAVLLAFVAIWFGFDRLAAALGSFRGEAGALVAAAVIGAVLIAEMALTRRGPLSALTALGFRMPRRDALMAALVLCVVLLAYFPAYAAITNGTLALASGWPLLAAGMFFQGGIAEEALFRGFLFRHIRARHSFWRAAWLSAIPFTAVHGLLFLQMDWPLALTALAIALALSFPLAWLFEAGGNSVWPPALVHFIVQGGIKLIDGAIDPAMAIGWMALGATAPWLFFLLKRPPLSAESR